jgi:hypothetical protein
MGLIHGSCCGRVVGCRHHLAIGALKYFRTGAWSLTSNLDLLRLGHHFLLQNVDLRWRVA